jgi:hypothetical protein
MPLLASSLQQPTENAMSPSDISAMLGNTASRPNHDLPSFPVNVQSRQGSPTKALGRRSPILEYQMASIAEVTGEEVTGGVLCRQLVPSSPISAAQNGLEQQSEGGYCNIAITQSVALASHSTEVHELHSHISSSSDTPGSLKYFSQNRSDPVSTLLNPISSSHNVENFISTVLTSNRLHHYQSNGGFVVEHDGVKLLIAYNPTQLNTIRMQFIAGDPIKYQTLSSHLAAHLQLTH